MMSCSAMAQYGATDDEVSGHMWYSHKHETPTTRKRRAGQTLRLGDTSHSHSLQLSQARELQIVSDSNRDSTSEKIERCLRWFRQHCAVWHNGSNQHRPVLGLSTLLMAKVLNTRFRGQGIPMSAVIEGILPTCIPEITLVCVWKGQE